MQYYAKTKKDIEKYKAFTNKKKYGAYMIA
jgi:hypothetical protein